VQDFGFFLGDKFCPLTEKKGGKGEKGDLKKL
jgi:hypothetical protein